MLSATGDVAPGRRWRMLPLGLRALTSTITGYARDNAFPSIECWGMLCVWPSSSFTKTHFQDLLVLYYYSRYSTFFFLFHLAGKLTFLWQGKDLLVFVNSETYFSLCLIESDPAIRGLWEFQARFYFLVLGTARGRQSHCVLVWEACLVQDEWKNGVMISSITCTQCCLQLFWMPLLVLLLKLQCKATWVIFTDIPLSPLWSVWGACRYFQQSVDIDCGCMGKAFGQILVQLVHIQPPWADLMCGQINIMSLPLFAPDLRELLANLSFCLDPLWRASLEEPHPGDRDS